MQRPQAPRQAVGPAAGLRPPAPSAAVPAGPAPRPRRPTAAGSAAADCPRHRAAPRSGAGVPGRRPARSGRRHRGHSAAGYRPAPTPPATDWEGKGRRAPPMAQSPRSSPWRSTPAHHPAAAPASPATRWRAALVAGARPGPGPGGATAARPARRPPGEPGSGGSPASPTPPRATFRKRQGIGGPARPRGPSAGAPAAWPTDRGSVAPIRPAAGWGRQAHPPVSPPPDAGPSASCAPGPARSPAGPRPRASGTCNTRLAPPGIRAAPGAARDGLRHRGGVPGQPGRRTCGFPNNRPPPPAAETLRSGPWACRRHCAWPPPAGPSTAPETAPPVRPARLA